MDSLHKVQELNWVLLKFHNKKIKLEQTKKVKC
jgi:hypothetical protein